MPSKFTPAPATRNAPWAECLWAEIGDAFPAAATANPAMFAMVNALDDGPTGDRVSGHAGIFDRRLLPR
jgi:hypothetical protein